MYIHFLIRGEFYSNSLRSWLNTLLPDGDGTTAGLNMYKLSEELCMQKQIRLPLSNDRPLPAPASCSALLQIRDFAGSWKHLMMQVPGEQFLQSFSSLAGIAAGSERFFSWIKNGIGILHSDVVLINDAPDPGLEPVSSDKTDKIILHRLPTLLWTRFHFTLNLEPAEKETKPTVSLGGNLYLFNKHAEAQTQNAKQIPDLHFNSIPSPYDRREIIRWIIHDYTRANRNIVTCLQEALVDPDWEVRAAALIASVRLHLPALRNQVYKTELPSTSREGLQAVERSILVGMKKMAWAYLVGQPLPAEPPAAPDTPETRKAHLMRCLAGLPVVVHDRCFLFIHSLASPIPSDYMLPAYLPEAVLCTNGRYQLKRSGIELAWIPPMHYWLGDDLPEGLNPIRHIKLERGFFIGKFPLKTAEIKSREKEVSGMHQKSHPYALLNQVDVYTIIKYFSAEEGISVTLPTAEEWEMASRGPNGRLFPWGNSYEKNMLHEPSPWAVMDTVGIGGEWATTPEGQFLLVRETSLRCSEYKNAIEGISAAVRLVVRT